MAAAPKAVLQRYVEDVWGNRNPTAAEDMLAADLVWHHPTLGERQGREAALEAIREMRAAFPDMVITVKRMAAEGDWAMAYWSATGTHRHPYRGVAPSGQEVTWEGAVLSRVVDGRIVETRAFPDTTTPGSPHEILVR